MKYLLFILLLLTGLFSRQVLFHSIDHSTGQSGPVQKTYYISNEGNSSNDGLSPLTPWPPVKVQGHQNYGDHIAILFKRGETFVGTVSTSGNFGITTPDSLIYGAYGKGPKPVITTMSNFPNANVATNWRAVRGLANVWAMKINPLTNYTPRVWLDGVEYQRAKDSTQVSATKRTCWVNADFEWEYVYAPANPATYYTSIKSASFTNNSFDISGQNYVAIRDLDIRGSQGASLDLAFNHHILVENCVIGKDGNRQGLRANTVSELVVRNDTFDTGERIKQDFNYSNEGGDGLILGQGNTFNVEAYGNYFMDWRHSAFLVEGDKATDSLVNIHIHHNLVTAKDIDYGRATAAYFYHSTNVVVDFNTFRNLPTQNQFAGNGYVFAHNIIDSMTNVAYAPYEMGTGIGLQIGHAYFPPQNMVFSDNVISNCFTAGIQMNGSLANDSSYGNVQNNVFANNVFINNGANVKQPYYDPTYFPVNCDIYMNNNKNVRNNTFINNVFFRKGTETPIYYGHDATGNYPKTVMQFNGMNGTAGDIIARNTIRNKQ